MPKISDTQADVLRECVNGHLVYFCARGYYQNEKWRRWEMALALKTMGLLGSGNDLAPMACTITPAGRVALAEHDKEK